MSERYFDELEVRDPDEREADLFQRLPDQIARAVEFAAGWAGHLGKIEPGAVRDRAALARLPVLRKSELMSAQRDEPPFGGFAAGKVSQMNRIFMSPGPIWEPQGEGADHRAGSSSTTAPARQAARCFPPASGTRKCRWRRSRR
jgi:phenylacetate-CoA ligase